MKSVVFIGIGGLILCSCNSSVKQTRALLATGQLEEAVLIAGDNREALLEISLDILTRALRDSTTQEQAFAEFRKGGRLAQKTFYQLVKDHDPVVSTLAAQSLFILGSSRRNMKNLLEKRIDSPNPIIRSAAIEALGQLYRKNRAFFERNLQEPDMRIRQATVDVLSKMPVEEEATWVIPLLEEVFRRDPALSVQIAALRVLARKSEDSQLLEAIRRSLRDDEPLALRLAALEALRYLDDQRAAETLLLEKMGSHERMELIRAAVVLASRENKDARLYENARHILSTALADPSVAIAGAAAIGAGQVGKDMENILFERLEERNEPEVKYRIAAALLCWNKSQKVLSILSELIEYPGWIGLQAALSLVRIEEDNQVAWNRIQASLDEDSVEVRRTAATSSGALSKGIDVALLFLLDESIQVRIAAAGSILQWLKKEWKYS